MFTPVLNSPQTHSSPTEPLNTNYNEHINSLQTSLVNQLEALPKTNSSLQQIFHLLPIIFRFLRKNFHSYRKLVHEYNDLSNSIQKLVSICAQYHHDRHDHENELLFFKDKISQILEQIGFTQYSLEQYWTITHCLEHEIERLQILLHNPQLLQINQRKFQVVQETKKIKLDRLIKENEQLQLLINKQTNSIETLQTKIELDLNELQKLKPIFEQVTLEQRDADNHWLQIGLFFKNFN
jgi:chromosome segregation ATPase